LKKEERQEIEDANRNNCVIRRNGKIKHNLNGIKAAAQISKGKINRE
jgi:hypothetical protein